MPERKRIGEMLKILRQERKLTQEGLEELTGIDQRQIARYEGGECYPKLDNFVKICKVLNADVARVLGVEARDEADKNDILATLAKMNSRQLRLARRIVRDIAEEG